MRRLHTCGVLLVLFLTGLSGFASDGDAKQIITQLRSTTLAVPYLCGSNFNFTPDAVFDAVYACLWRRSVEVLAYDKNDGIIAWCDTGGSFVPLPTEETPSDTMDRVAEATTDLGSAGYTYGSAVITKLSEARSLLSVYTMGRSPNLADESYSNGTYERGLINSVSRQLYKTSIGQAQNPPPPPVKFKRVSPATNYASAYRGRYQNMVCCTPDLITAKTKGTTYSVPASQLWGSLLAVIAQYDVIIDLEPQEHKVVFARRVSVPDQKNGDTTKRADALVAALVQPDSTNSCIFYLAALDEQSLAPVPIGSGDDQNKENRLALSTNMPNFMKAAITVSGQLDQQIDIQMFYTERWGNKFMRRSGTPATRQP